MNVYHQKYSNVYGPKKHKKNFSEVKLETQESFLMNHSQRKIKQMFESTYKPVNQQMLKLRELIHPQHFGGKFQALWGVRK